MTRRKFLKIGGLLCGMVIDPIAAIGKPLSKSNDCQGDYLVPEEMACILQGQNTLVSVSRIERDNWLVCESYDNGNSWGNPRPVKVREY